MKQFSASTVTAIALVTGLAVLHAKDANGQSQVPAATGTSPRQAEIDALQDWVEMAKSLHDRVAAKYQSGAAGGEAEQEALARYQVAMAQARLAAAQNQLDQCRKFYLDAVQAANDGITAIEAAYDAGTIGLSQLLVAQENYAKARIELSRLPAAAE